jgi:hypothetical protein
VRGAYAVDVLRTKERFAWYDSSSGETKIGERESVRHADNHNIEHKTHRKVTLFFCYAVFEPESVRHADNHNIEHKTYRKVKKEYCDIRIDNDIR